MLLLAAPRRGRRAAADRAVARRGRPRRRGLRPRRGGLLGGVHPADPGASATSSTACTGWPSRCRSPGSSRPLVAGPGTWPSMTWEVALIGLGLAVLLPVVPFSLEMLALRRLTTAAFGTLMSLEPAIALVVGLLLLHQTPGLWPVRRDRVRGRRRGSAPSAPAPVPHAAPRDRGRRGPAAPVACHTGAMSARFEELDWRETPMGEISLRRRREPVLDVDVFEVRLGDEYLMSSLFTVAEIELSRLGLAAHRGDRARRARRRAGPGLHRGRRPGGPAGRRPHRGRGAARGRRLARAPAAAGLRRAGLGRAHPAGHRRLLHHDRGRAAALTRRARPAVRRAARRHRPQPAARAAPEPRGVLLRAPACAGCASGCGPAACSRSGPTTRRTRTSSGCSRRSSASVEAHVVEFDNFLTGGTSANTVYVAR